MSTANIASVCNVSKLKGILITIHINFYISTITNYFKELLVQVLNVCSLAIKVENQTFSCNGGGKRARKHASTVCVYVKFQVNVYAPFCRHVYQ